MIKVIITDDHPVVRKGLKQIIDECPEMKVVDEAGQGSELLAKIMNNEYDVVLLDISMPGRNGLEILKEIKKIKPNLGVLMLSIYPKEQYAVRAIKLGASGYLTKDSIPSELISAIKKIAEGSIFITPSLAETIALGLDESSHIPLHKNLSDREFEVMCKIAEGKTPTEIAEKLSLSVKTISTYRTRILAKMNLKNNTDLIRYALKAGLVE